MIILDEFRVPDTAGRIRLVDYVVNSFDQIATRSGAKKAISRGKILVDGQARRQSDFVLPGQMIRLVDPEAKQPKVFELKLKIVFEDNSMAVVYKPAGIAVSGNRFKTLRNALPHNLSPSKAADALMAPLPVHRLDFPTQGLVLVAKTNSTLAALGRQFEQRTIAKTYHAIVAGKPEAEGTVDNMIAGQAATTRYRVVKSIPSLKTGSLSLVEIQPETGRTHQIRIHMAGMGHPIVGDTKYTEGLPVLKGKGLFLCATRLEFSHPVNGKPCTFTVDIPEKYESLLKRELTRWKKYNS